MSDEQGTIEGGWTPPLVREQLAWAPQLEMWTIPLYLSAAYSIDLGTPYAHHPGIAPFTDDPSKVDADGLPVRPYGDYTLEQLKQACFNVVFSVAIQEMLHLELAANLSNALGAEVCLVGPDRPRYTGVPKGLTPPSTEGPWGDVGRYVQGLLSSGSTLIQPMSDEQIRLFQWVEHRAPEVGHGPKPSYASIGDFYESLRFGIDAHAPALYPPPYVHGEKAPTADQLRQKNAFSTEGKSRHGDNYPGFSNTISGPLKQALGQINVVVEAIVEQGEGGAGEKNVNPAYLPSGTDHPEETELDHLTHLDRFVTLQEIWAAAAKKAKTEGGSLILTGKEGGAPEYAALLQITFGDFLRQLTEGFGSEGSGLALNGMGRLGGRIHDVWRDGGWPDFGPPPYARVASGDQEGQDETSRSEP